VDDGWLRTLSAVRTEHATRVARRLGYASPAALPSWVLELIRDCVADGVRLVRDVPQRPVTCEPPAEVTRVGRWKRRG
jgi:hypothetical protein